MFEAKQRLIPNALPRRMRDLVIAEVAERPEVIFLVAEHNPDSTVLLRELRKIGRSSRADHKVASASPLGYALFHQRVLPLDEYIARHADDP
jgi:hypothetical protein